MRPTFGGARATEPPMQVFHHDDAGYRAWVGAHPEGYVLNVPHGYRRSHPSRLHQASCRVIAKADPAVRQTRDARKVCATDQAALLEWAKQHGYTLLPCSFCDPP